jgi:hypothetical protein
MGHLQAIDLSLNEHPWKSFTTTGYPIMSFKPDFIYLPNVLNVIFYSIDYLYLFSFLFHILFSLFILGLKRRTSIHFLFEVLVQPLSRMLVQSEPHSHRSMFTLNLAQLWLALAALKIFMDSEPFWLLV